MTASLGPTAVPCKVTVHGHSMFRLVDRPLSFRQRASEWIYKMLFLWSREPVPSPKAGPWFAWFATALVLWRCRRGLTKAILAASPLRLLRKRGGPPTTTVNRKVSSTGRLLKRPYRPKRRNPILQRKYRNAASIRRRVKRFCTGDGPHVTASTPMIPTSQQIYYRVTRSGKVYGKYPNKIATPSNASSSSQGSQ